MVRFLPFLCIFFFAGQALARHGLAKDLGDQEYVYSWRGRIVGGITEISHRMAGLGFHAKVSIMPAAQQPADDTEIVCQITEFRRAEINDKFDHTLDPFEQYHKIEHLPEDLPEDMLNLIKHPFMVVLEENGKIKKMQFSHEDPEWLRNLKKSFIGAAFNFKLDGQEEIPHKETEDKPLHYTVMEESVIGTCKTAYSISPLAEYMVHHGSKMNIPVLKNTEEHFVVTKTIDHSHCATDNAWRHVSPGVEKCHHGEVDCTNKESRTTSEMYIMQGDMNSFFVQYANIHGDYYFRPIGHDNEQTFDVLSVMEIELKEVKPTSRHPTVPHPEIVTSLNGNYRKHGSHSLVESPLRDTTHFMNKGELNSEFYDNVHYVLEKIHNHEVEATEALQSLAFSIQQLHLDEMKTVWEHVSGHQLTTSKYRTAQHTNPWTQRGMSLTTTNQPIMYEAEKKAKIDVVMDVLAMTGTNPSIVLLSNLITNGELTAERAAQAFMTVPLTIKTPTIEVLQELLELLKTDFVQSHEKTLGAGMLALSNIIHNYCISDSIREKSYPNSGHCDPHHPFILHEVIPFLSKETTSYSMKIQKLMALGNLGMVEILPILKSYARGEVTDDITLRQTAIYGLTKLSGSYPRLVEKELMPVFQNRMDHFEVRQAALMVILHTNPSPAVFKEIASSTWFEPSHQIQNYIYSIFDALVHYNFGAPGVTDIKAKAKMALHLTKPAHHGDEYSHFKMLSTMINDFKQGVLLESDILGNQNGLMPTVAYYRLQEIFGGKEYSNFEYKFFLEGIIHTYQMMMGVDHHSEHKQPLTAVWFKLLNNMERFLTMEQIMEGFGADSMHNLLMSLSINRGININFSKALPGAEVQMILPTELGLPLYINSHFPKYLDVHGNVKGSLMDPSNRGVNTGVMIDMENEFMFNAFVISPISKNMVGAGIKISTEVHLPLNLQVQLNINTPGTQDKALKLTWTVPNTDKPILKHDVVPYTFNKKYDYLPFMLEDSQKSVIEHQEEKHTEEHHFGKNLFGLDMVAKVESDQTHMSHGSLSESLMGQTWLSLITNFYTPTSWRSSHCSLSLNHATSTTNVVKADLKYTKPHIYEMNANLEGKETHTYQAILHYETDEFQISSQNLTFKLHQTHPNEPPHDFELDETLTFPKIDMTKRNDIYNQDLTTKGHGQITFGPASSTPQQINWRCKMEQTPDMKTFAMNTPDKILCDKDESLDHTKYSPHCINALHHATTLNKKTIDFVYEDAEIPPYMYDYLHYILNVFKVCYHKYETIDHTVTHKPGHLTLSFEKRPKTKSWDIEVIRPAESIVFRNIPKLPETMETLDTEVIVNPINRLGPKKSNEYHSTPYCMAQGNMITTFDNVTYSTSGRINSNCWYTVAKSCHNDKIKPGVMIQHNDKGIQVKVMLDNTHSVMLENQNGNVIVKVNGEVQDLPNNDKMLILVPGTSVIIHAGKIYNSLTLLDFDNLGFKIMHDGSAAWMELEHMYKNKMCGMCGNFNGEPDDDMYTSQECVHQNKQEFISSWVHPTDTCQPPAKFVKDCVKTKAMTTAEATVHVRKQFLHEHHDNCTRLAQMVQYFDHEICISTEKVSACEMHCTAIYPTVINTSFYCDEPTEEMKNLAKQVHEGHFVDVHEHRMTYLDVTHPQMCLKNGM